MSRDTLLRNPVHCLRVRSLGIYFDGVLPSTKIDTRRARLQNIVDRLVVIRDKYSPRDQRRVPMSEQLGFDAKVPEPPFMVVAAIEAISDSGFADRISVVPTEADIQCIKAATEHNQGVSKPHVIITNDSDLLAAATGDQTRIMMLHELTRAHDGSGARVQARIFHPAGIALAVGVQSMMDAAFYMAQDRHMTLETAASTARRSNYKSSQEYATFCQQYLSDDSIMTEPSATLHDVTRMMDPRIAELAHQLLPTLSRGKDSAINVFLPPLLEDTGVPSAWKIGSQLRGSIYATLLSTTPGVDKVTERARHGHHVGRREHARSNEWLAEIADYAAWIQDVFSTTNVSSCGKAQLSVRRFRYLAALMVVDFHASEGRTLSKQQIFSLLMRAISKDWTQLQLDAMFQAALYSLRMAKQLLAFETARSGTRPKTRALAQALQDMPEMASLLDRLDEDTNEAWMVFAEELKDRLDIRMEISENEDPDDSIEDADEEGDDDKGRDGLVNNPFAMLSK